jgi:hypothetical protein
VLRDSIIVRPLIATTLVYLLAVLLASTSPAGTGRGAHHDQLLDLLIPHSHPFSTSVDYHAVDGPVLGAESGASLAPLGVPVTPVQPYLATPVLRGIDYRWVADPLLRPSSRTETPPDPPPNAA